MSTDTLDPVDLLARLPIADEAQGVGVYVLDESGRVCVRRGFDDGLPARVDPATITASLPEGRRLRVLAFDEGLRLLFTFGPEGESALDGVVDSMTALVREWLRLELDLERISPSSLALMEEVAMVHELTSRLPTCASVADVARLALEELMVAADVERGFYVAFDRAASRGSVVVALRHGRGSRRPVTSDDELGRELELGDGLLARIAARSGGSVIEVAGDAPLGRPGSPEAMARREVLAVPVAYGDGEVVRNVGALVLCDKRGGRRAFGSQESKMAINVAALVGGAIGHRIVAALGKEIELAREIQRQILPEQVATVPGFDVAGSCETSGSVGGDYYDFVPMADGRTLAVVADVSGHNLASGMVMVGARSSLRVLASRTDRPSAIFEALLESTFDDLQRTELFVTAAAAALPPDGGEIEVVNAGHNDVFVCRGADGAIETLPSVGAVFGFRRGERYASARVSLAPGDSLLLYTDGLVEARNRRGEMFGEGRLATAIAHARAGSAQEILAAVREAAMRFTGRQDLEDDVTSVVVKRPSVEIGSGDAA